MYKKICVDCELLRRQKWVNEDPHLFSRRQCPEITDGTVANDATAEGWTVVEVSRGSESQSSGVNQPEGGEPVSEVPRGSESPGNDDSADVLLHDPEPPKYEWATLGVIRHENDATKTW